MPAPLVALPVFLVEVIGWPVTAVGTFMALWVIGYGFVQASAPKLIRRSHHGQGPGSGAARFWAFILALFPAGIVIAMQQGWPTETVLVSGLILFGIVFAINSAVHSYLILAYSDHDKVSMNVGFYYMANAGGRLAGTVLSGLFIRCRGLRPVCGFLQALSLLRPYFLLDFLRFRKNSDRESRCLIILLILLFFSY